MDNDEKTMQTVITKILAVINNQLRSVRRYVRLVGERQHFEIEIKQFKDEPRCLCQCSECEFARITIFPASMCENIDDIRSNNLACSKGQDIWQEASCSNFSAK